MGMGAEETMFFSGDIANSGAAMNPCVSVASCRTEPTKNWRHAQKHLWYGAESDDVLLPPICDPPSMAGTTHKYDTALNNCPTYTCASWCNIYTTGMSACSSCQLNIVKSTPAYCASWCNVYTCSFSYCGGCDSCDAVLAGTHCYSWCNAFTCGMSACSSCSTCAAITAGTYYASWCNSYTCFLPGNICAGYP